MIKHSFSKFGTTFSEAVSVVTLIVIRKDAGSDGINQVSVLVKIYPDQQNINNKEISEMRIFFFKDIPDNFNGISFNLSNIYSDGSFNFSGDINRAIETELLTIPEIKNGTRI